MLIVIALFGLVIVVVETISGSFLTGLDIRFKRTRSATIATPIIRHPVIVITVQIRHLNFVAQQESKQRFLFAFNGIPECSSSGPGLQDPPSESFKLSSII